jgi:hypothetical protein
MKMMTQFFLMRYYNHSKMHVYICMGLRGLGLWCFNAIRFIGGGNRSTMCNV